MRGCLLILKYYQSITDLVDFLLGGPRSLARLGSSCSFRKVLLQTLGLFRVGDGCIGRPGEISHDAIVISRDEVPVRVRDPHCAPHTGGMHDRLHRLRPLPNHD